MPTGPIVIYDKSFLQGINPDEAFFFGMHYMTNIAPVLFVEVLGNLSKAPPTDRTAEDVVRRLAEKVSDLSTHPNMPHHDITIAELLGHAIPMDGRPIIRAAQYVRGEDGSEGAVVFDAPEMQALDRWRDQDFQTLERRFARHWRESIQRIDLAAAASAMRDGYDAFQLPDLAAVKAFADMAASPKYGRYRQLKYVLAAYEVPAQQQATIISRWRRAGRPPLSKFAPYTHYRLTVDLFFNLAIASGHIGTGDAKNKVDIAYLYYLPLCCLFVSGDRLHRRTVPLFLRPNQKFIPADELKADLARLVAYYDALPQDVREAGALKYAAYPPLEGDYLTCRLHDEFFPSWRTRAAQPPVALTAEENDRIVARSQGLIAAAKARGPTQRSTTPFDELDHLVVEHKARRRIGRWKVF
jgi:hypothetical protein